MIATLIGEIKAALDEPFLGGWDVSSAFLILLLMLVIVLSWHSLQNLM